MNDILYIRELETYSFTEEGVDRAVDGVDIGVQPGMSKLTAAPVISD